MWVQEGKADFLDVLFGVRVQYFVRKVQKTVFLGAFWKKGYNFGENGSIFKILVQGCREKSCGGMCRGRFLKKGRGFTGGHF